MHKVHAVAAGSLYSLERGPAISALTDGEEQENQPVDRAIGTAKSHMGMSICKIELIQQNLLLVMSKIRGLRRTEKETEKKQKVTLHSPAGKK